MPESQVNLHQLHSDILEYLTQNSHIMSCNKLSTFDEFTVQTKFQYFNYSREDLRHEFLQKILPKVFSYNLNEIQKRKIEIFATHSGFIATDRGYKPVEPAENFPIEGVHYTTSKEVAREHNISCIIGQFTSTPTPDQKIKAWVSAVNSTDDELAFNRMLPKEELRSRLNQSHDEYKTNGTLPPNLSPNIATKIITYRNTIEKLSSELFPIKN